MLKVGDRVIRKDYEFENLYARKTYTILYVIYDKYIILKEDKDKFQHRIDSFIIDLKETRKLKLEKIWSQSLKLEIK